MLKGSLSVLPRYGVALVSLTLALILTLLLTPLISPLLLSLFLTAVVSSAWYGGRRPASLVALLSALVIAFFLMPPMLSFNLNSLGELGWLVLFLLVGALLIGIIDALHAARRQAEASAQEAQRHQDALRASHEQMNNLLARITDCFYALDRDWQFTYLNPQAEAYFGHEPEALLGRSLWEVFPAARGSVFEEQFHRAVSQQAPVHFEAPSQTVPGRWAELHVYPSPDGLSVFFRDLTEFKQARETLARDAMLLANVRDSVIVTDLEGVVTYWNEGATRLFGWEAAEMVGRPYQDRFPEPARSFIVKSLHALAEGAEWNGEWEDYRKDGSRVWIDARVCRVTNPTGEPVGSIGLAHDVTARKQAEEAQRVSEERFRVALKHSPITVSMTDRDLRYTWLYNPPPDLSVEAALGKRDDELLPLQDVCELVAFKRAILESGTGKRQEICLTVQGETRVYDGTGEPLTDAAGQIVGVTVAVMEITERKRLEEELRRRAEALSEADQRKDEFLAMLAHELRNPLAPIRNAAEMLKQVGGPDPRLIRVREIIDRQVRHQARLLDDLLEVSRLVQGKVSLRRDWLDLTRLVRETAEDFRSVVEQAGLTLSLELPDRPVWMEGDATRLAQIVGNLLHNATKFTNREGQIAVRVSVEPGEPIAAFTVRDTGIGIEPEMLQRVFETFAQADRSLDRSQGGLGLGLALVKGLVELHGGEVRAYSAGRGQGTEFTVWLPVASTAIAPTLSETIPAALRGAGSLRILIIEDNRDAAESLCELLEWQGCTVAVAYSGTEGVEAARRFRPEVVLCDLGLPGMDGYQVGKALRRDPDLGHLRLIAVSGYGQEEDQRRSREVGFDHHLVKPVDYEVLQSLLVSASTT